MRVWNSLDEVPTDLPRTVVTLGNFDGVHLGHQSVLALAHAAAGELAGKPRYTVSDFGRFTPNHGRPTTLLVCD